MEKEEHVPENAIFCCFGCMSSVGTLTGVAVLEAYKKLDKEKNGLFCTSAIAAGVPKHRKTTDKARTIIVIDGCYNKCTTKILYYLVFKMALIHVQFVRLFNASLLDAMQASPFSA